MKARLGIGLATIAAAGCAAFLIVGADAQDAAVPAPAPATPAGDARPLPPQGNDPRNFDPGQQRGRNGYAGRFSPQDRAAFFDAHVAAVRAGLELTPDQEKLWPPVEQAVRDAAKTMIAQRQQRRQEGRPADPVERLRRLGDSAAARGDALHKLADAAAPLWSSLSDEQKRRLPILMHGMQGQNGWRRRMHAMWQRFTPGGQGNQPRN